MFHVDPRSDEALPTSCQFRATILALLFVLHPILAHAEFMRKVVGVIDGDSIRVMHDSKAEQVRLLEVDCPEKRQPFGTRAKDYAQSWLLGKMSRLRGQA